ncbi:MAG: 50S ribosomal protein L11 methyltransferase [Betaproteobacteria bacterium]|nr:50S ribosomal protein L11 methyltransferase [Betaproteobacteria bacterium]
MKWQRIRFVVDAELAERLGDTLLERGAVSVDAADAQSGTPDEHPIFGEPGSDPAVWPRTELTALFEAGDPARAVAEACAEVGIDTPECVLDDVADQDWVRLTQSQFDPIEVANGLWIVPSWHEPPDSAAMVIRLDPGLAFGTGSHPTTRLCLRWLLEHVTPGQSVLDYGCGSGILAIAASLAGAGTVAGVDVDENALVAARQNANVNGVSAEFSIPRADAVPQYDIVVANILANPLRVLAPLICGHCKPGGMVVLSGLLEEQSDDVMSYYESWLEFERPPRVEEGWACLAGRKRPGERA